MGLSRAWLAVLFVPLTVACTALLGDFSVTTDANDGGESGDGNTANDGAQNGDGAASCTGTQTACGSDCAELQTSAAHCGTCDHACTTGFSCSGGVCDNAVTTMISGGTTTCAALKRGDVYCWGDNTQGQVGIGDVTTTHPPTLVAHDSKNNPFTALASIGLGRTHACAASSTGIPLCWGSNTLGQTATGNVSPDGGILPVPTPTPAAQKSGPFGPTTYVYSAMSTGAAAGHQCAITLDAGLVCWGNNDNGQLGHVDAGFLIDSTCTEYGSVAEDCSAVPFPAEFAGSVKQAVAGNAHTCVLDTTGNVSCWGNGFDGQLGNGRAGLGAGTGPAPTPVQGLDGGITEIAAGESVSCAVKKDGTVWCWGYSTDGELGYPGSHIDAGDFCCSVEGCFNNTCFARPSAIQIAPITNAVDVSVGCDHVCATESDGSVWCWGNNVSGELGNGTTATTPTPPTKVTGISNAVGVTAGCGHTCAWLKDGTASCWGLNDHGQLGNGSVNSATPIAVKGLP